MAVRIARGQLDIAKRPWDPGSAKICGTSRTYPRCLGLKELSISFGYGVTSDGQLGAAVMTIDALRGIAERLGEVVVDPGLWPDLLDQVSQAIGARGAILLPNDVRTADVPMTASVREPMLWSFQEGWHERDLRSVGLKRLHRGALVIRELDFLDIDRFKASDVYNECMAPIDIPWFAGVAAWAGENLWVAAFQRRARQGPFSDAEVELLATLSPHLTQAATISAAVGRRSLVGVTNALEHVDRPAIAIDRLGRVLETNAIASRLFDREIRVNNRVLAFSDAKAQAKWNAFLLHMRHTPDSALLPMRPIIVQRGAARPLIVRALPVDGAARNPFLGARVILAFSDLGRESAIDGAMLRQLFGLSVAEARVAALVGQGRSVDDAAETLGLARETIRNQLKAVYSKTGTSRHAELVALLSRLG